MLVLRGKVAVSTVLFPLVFTLNSPPNWATRSAFWKVQFLEQNVGTPLRQGTGHFLGHPRAMFCHSEQQLLEVGWTHNSTNAEPPECSWTLASAS